MKILGKNLKYGEVSIEITNPEDLWYLSHIINPGEFVSGQTERKIKIGSGENTKTVRKQTHLEIKTEKIEYQTDTLKVLGIITQGPDDVPRGEHHSFNIRVKDRIKIKKQSWLNYELKKLQDAEKEQTKILLVAFDREEAKFAELKKSGYEELSELKGDVQKKADQETRKDNFYKEISKQIQEYTKRLDIKQIIIASPAFWKEYLLKEMSEELKKITVSATISGVDKNSFREILQRPELQAALESERTTQELNIITEILSAISKEKAFYGEKEANKKISEGAAKIIAISENLLKEKKDKEKYAEIDNIMRTAENTKTEIFIISSGEAMNKLDSLGGIAGILRW